MLQKNNGITLISLVVTIVLMLILASVAISTGIDSYKNSLVTRFVAQMQLIQQKVDVIAEEIRRFATPEEQLAYLQRFRDK